MFIVGDRRGNQNPQITSLHILMLRHHNNIASALKEVNPHWNDGKLFHESRRILIAEYQYITFYEFLPILLGIIFYMVPILNSRAAIKIYL